MRVSLTSFQPTQNTNICIGEGNFDDQSAKVSGAGTPVPEAEEVSTPGPVKKKPGRVGTGKSKKAKTAAQRLAIIDAAGDLGMGGGN